MISLLLVLIFAGCVLGLRWRVLSLVPATLLAWAAAVYVAEVNDLSIGQTIVFTFLCGALLQFSYIFSNILFYTEDRSAVLPLSHARLWHYFSDGLSNKQPN